MGWSWQSTVMETENPEETIEKMIDLGIAENRSDLTIIDDQTIHTKLKWNFHSYYPIRYKKLLRLTDLADRVGILENREYVTPKATLLSLGDDKVIETEIVSSGNFSFLKDYFFQKYDLKIIPRLITGKTYYPKDTDFNYEKFESLEELFRRYEDTNFEFQETRGKYAEPQLNHRKHSYYQSPDYSFTVNADIIEELSDFIQEKNFDLHSESMRHYFEMASSYKLDDDKLTPHLIPITNVKENFDNKELIEYIRDLCNEGESSDRDYSKDEFFLSDNIRGGMNYPPDPKSTDFDRGGFEVYINEKSFGEIECSIVLAGTINFEEISEEFRFMTLFSYSWLSENPKEELKELQEICKLPLRTLIPIKIYSLLKKKSV